MVRAILVVALVSAPAFAQTIYRWTDARGTVHYSDDAAAAPKGVKVETTQGDELNDITIPKADKPATFAANDPMAIPPPPALSNDRGDEEYWRGEFQRVHEKVQGLETDVAIDQKKLGDPSMVSSTSDYGCAPGAYGYGANGGYADYRGNGVAQPGVVYGNGRQRVGPQPGNPGYVSPYQGQTVQYPPYIAPRYGYLPYYCDFQRMRDRIEANKAALARAKEELGDLERRAANASVPLEWRR